MSTNSGSRRAPANSTHRTLSTVDKTIEHFNAVVARVVATILKEQDEPLRGSVMQKWIDIAHQCRQLKNFSSLTAILNGLQSGCIYRLSTAWSYVSQQYKSILEELKNVFGSCGDRQQARAILEQVSQENGQRIVRIPSPNRIWMYSLNERNHCFAATRRSPSGLTRVCCRFEYSIFDLSARWLMFWLVYTSMHLCWLFTE